MSTDLEPTKTTFAGAPCTADEARALTDRIRGTVTAAWVLLLEAYERGAWAALGYGRWEDYVAAEFHLSRSRSYQLLDLGRVARELPAGGSGSMSTKVDTDPLPETHARELAPLLDQPDEMREVYTEAVERTNGRPTAAVLRVVREHRRHPADLRRHPAELGRHELLHGTRRLDAMRIIGATISDLDGIATSLHLLDQPGVLDGLDLSKVEQSWRGRVAEARLNLRRFSKLVERLLDEERK